MLVMKKDCVSQQNMQLTTELMRITVGIVGGGYALLVAIVAMRRMWSVMAASTTVAVVCSATMVLCAPLFG